MKTQPIVRTFDDNSKAWEHTFEFFKTKVYVPTTKLPEKIINYGYDAPYLLVFEEKEMTMETAKQYADNTGLAQIASDYATSVVFIYPNCEGGWSNATKDLWIELISKSKIHEYHEDGYVILNNRFTKQCDGYAIRGAIFRTFIFSKGASADYVATNLIDTIEYDYPTFHLSMDCFWCEVETGELKLLEAEAAKWLAKDELDSVEWLPADITLIDKIRENMS